MAAYLLAVAILFCIQDDAQSRAGHQGQCRDKASSPSKILSAMPFMEVYERSVCQTREMLVSILDEHPDEVAHLFRPSCVTVLRCGGCCTDESLTCTATGKRSVGREIMRVDPHKGTSKIEVMQFTEHTECECRKPEEGEPRAKFPFV
ncbi:hypothetical protein Chor_001835 [Crotalus horridus]